MGQTKYINSKSFTATNTFRSAATITVLVFCLSAARGENLTTLDGRTFTNVYSVTNYSSVVVIRHDGGMTGVKPSSLPEDFRAKYGIKIPTNVITASGQKTQQTNSLDVFFSYHSDSALTLESGTNRFEAQSFGSTFHSWSIKVSAKGFELWVGTIIDDSSHPENHLNIQQSASFKFNQEMFVVAALNKVVEWGKIASEKKAEAFEKIIGSLPDEILGNIGEKNDYTFYWSTDQNAAGYGLKGPGFVFNQEEISHLIDLMQSLPSLKQQLAEKIKNQAVQQVLFK